MPDTTGATLGGAASGAASGAAIGSVVPVLGTGVGALVGAGVGALGGYLSASGTADAQATQNKAAAQTAAAQSAQSFYNYLASRGVSLQQLVAAYPEFQTEYARLQAAGQTQGQDFQTWLVKAINANQGHPIWTAIANPAGTAGAANTTLPAWAVGADGKPIQPSLFQQLVGISSGTNTPATAPVGSIATLANARALLQARPEIVAELQAAGVGNDGRSMEQWLVDHITQTESASGGGTFTDALRKFLSSPDGAASGAPGAGGLPAGPAGTGNNTTLDPAIAGLIGKSTGVLGGVFDGTYLNEVLAGLGPVAAARNAAAAATGNRVNELRGLSGTLLDTELGGIKDVLDARTAGAAGVFDASSAAANSVYNTNIDKLASLLGVRREAAQAIYDASVQSAGGVRDARTTGARGIYDAELLRADTYSQAAQQALNRVLAEQSAERARRGFTGGSSGSDMTRARLNAEYLQKGAGERAGAGVNYQTRLSDAGVGYATDFGRAGVGRATTLGQASEMDAMAKLTAAVDLARQLGLAGVGRATTMAGAGEQDAIAKLQARVADAQRRMGYLTSDADLAKAQADLQNAQDALTALLNDQNRKVGAVGAPFSLAGMDLGLKGALNDQQYSAIDALLKRLGGFSTTPASGPGLTTSTPGSVLNNNQILGGALGGLGSVIGNTSSNQTLMDLIKALGNREGIGAPTTYSDFLKSNPGSSAAGGSAAANGLTSVFTPVGFGDWSKTPGP